MSNPDVKDEAGDRARLIERAEAVRRMLRMQPGYVGTSAAVNAWMDETIAALPSDAKDQRIAELEAKFSAMLKAEHDLSDAYLRLRKIVPGGLNTAGLRGEDIWEHVELCALGLVARAEAAESQLRLTGTDDAGVRGDGAAQSVRFARISSTDPAVIELYLDCEATSRELAQIVHNLTQRT